MRSDVICVARRAREIWRWLDEYFELALGVALILTIAVVLSVQVFMRYVVHSSLSWSEELARYLFVWLIYLGISYGAKTMRHIKIDAGLYLFPIRRRRTVVLVGDVLFLIFCAVVTVYATKLSVRQYLLQQESPAMGVPMYWLYMAPAVGFFLTGLRQVQTIAWRVRHRHDPAAPDSAVPGL